VKEKIKKHEEQIKEFKANSKEELEQFRIKFLGRSGLMKELTNEFRSIPNEEKRDVGQLLNGLKEKIKNKLEQSKESLSSSESTTQNNNEDFSRPTGIQHLGSRHPLSMVRNEIIDIFSRIGFTVAEGPEIEDDWHVFSGLNFPPEHPARDMQDTFFIEKNPDIMLRTHTSSVQVRMMENSKLPLRILMPGRVFRNEAISARAHCIFHQVEGLYIDKDVSFADLKQTLMFFAKELFGEKTKIRLRPSYFPFTEPSAEVDVTCSLCNGKGCNVCKYTGYLEIMGCGMVDPNVLRDNGIDPEVYSGFAFGMGIERITMLKYQINDLRYFFENDVRFLNQFSGII